jgi:acetyl-CoA carboxylase carboxyltransferase component
MAQNMKTSAELREEVKASSADARVLLSSLFDEGTFLEFGTFVKYGEGNFEGVITGCGSVCGRPVYAFLQDKTVDKAAFTAAHGKKICNLYDSALKAGAPVIGVFSGAGAKVSEGIDCLSAYGAVMSKIAEAKALIPQIAVINGACGGASAVVSEMFDLTVATENGDRYLVANGESIGNADIITTEASLANELRALISLLPSNCEEGTVVGDDCLTINEPLDVSAYVNGDVKDLISALSDDHAPLFLTEKSAAEIVTALMTFNGRVIGVVANQPTENGGALTCASAKKAARFVNFCSDYDIPVLTLVNTVGFKGSCKNYLTTLSDLAFAYNNCETAVTAIIGNAFGSAYTLMGSKSLGASFVFALDSAVISVLDPDTAVEFLYDSALKEAADPNAARASLKEEWISGPA